MAATLIPFTDWLKNYLSQSYKKERAIQKPRPKRALSQPVYTRSHLAHIAHLELLKELKFKIKYILRIKNERVDTLSRRLDYIEGKEIVNIPILR